MENEFEITFECNALDGTLFNAGKYEIRLGDFISAPVNHNTAMGITAWFLGRGIRKMVDHNVRRI